MMLSVAGKHVIYAIQENSAGLISIIYGNMIVPLRVQFTGNYYIVHDIYATTLPILKPEV